MTHKPVDHRPPRCASCRADWVRSGDPPRPIPCSMQADGARPNHPKPRSSVRPISSACCRTWQRKRRRLTPSVPPHQCVAASCARCLSPGQSVEFRCAPIDRRQPVGPNRVDLMRQAVAMPEDGDLPLRHQALKTRSDQVRRYERRDAADVGDDPRRKRAERLAQQRRNHGAFDGQFARRGPSSSIMQRRGRRGQHHQTRRHQLALPRTDAIRQPLASQPDAIVRTSPGSAPPPLAADSVTSLVQKRRDWPRPPSGV